MAGLLPFYSTPVKFSSFNYWIPGEQTANSANIQFISQIAASSGRLEITIATTRHDAAEKL